MVDTYSIPAVPVKGEKVRIGLEQSIDSLIRSSDLDVDVLCFARGAEENHFVATDKGVSDAVSGEEVVDGKSCLSEDVRVHDDDEGGGGGEGEKKRGEGKGERGG